MNNNRRRRRRQLTATTMSFLVWCCIIVAVVLASSTRTTIIADAFELTTTPPLLNVPTYSLATLGRTEEDEDGLKTTTNMNIVTYATPISITPNRLWAIGLFKGTLSHTNFISSRCGVLQLLTEKHTPLVKLLGGTSGNDINKQVECEKLGFTWTELVDGDNDDNEQKYPLVLPCCLHYICLEQYGDSIIDGGNHDIVICKVKSMYTTADVDDNIQLSTAKLREMGIITEQGRVAE